jgi:hypothetical protein
VGRWGAFCVFWVHGPGVWLGVFSVVVIFDCVLVMGVGVEYVE